MNMEKFSQAMNEIEDKYISEAIGYQKKKGKKSVFLKWGTMAACVCLLVMGGVAINQNRSTPVPDAVQIPSPIFTVENTEEMETYLNASIPVLDKKVASYSVIVLEDAPTIGIIEYSDGSEFRMQSGSGDISGIYGGELAETKYVEDIKVMYYKYEDTTYAVWEENGFSFSYVYINDKEEEVQTLIGLFA